MKHFAAILYLTLCEFIGVAIGTLAGLIVPSLTSVSTGSAIVIATGCCMIAFGISMERWKKYRSAH